MRRIPKRWQKYTPMGSVVPGTRFLPFKVPLKLELSDVLAEEEWFTPQMLIEQKPMLKAVIDLTDTNRYYDSEEFTSRGVEHLKINICGGGTLPPMYKLKEFFNAVDRLLRKLAHDSDALIGVHCTHGLNRTGYLICKYMVSRMKIDPRKAIKKFEDARGFSIERSIYVNDVLMDKPISTFENIRKRKSNQGEVENWRTESSSRSQGGSRYK